MRIRQIAVNVVVVSVCSLMFAMGSLATAAVKAESHKRFTMPDFRKLTSAKVRKTEFYAFLRPMVEAENARITVQRSHLVNLYRHYKLHKQMTQHDAVWLQQVATHYGLKQFAQKKDADWLELVQRVDVVPTTLVLAQAANESAYGTSRFAREGFNLFGEWCFKAGCGVVPAHRAKGKHHEVKKFATPQLSIRAYLNNINSSSAYRSLRLLRYQQRLHGEPLDASELAGGLLHYSARGQAYVTSIRRLLNRDHSLMYQVSRM